MNYNQLKIIAFYSFLIVFLLTFIQYLQVKSYNEPNFNFDTTLMIVASSFFFAGLGIAWRNRVTNQTAEIDHFTSLENLSNRENEILQLLVEGKSNKEIASSLFISLATVKSHISSVYRKLEVPNRPAAILKVLQPSKIHTKG
jgi:DNA-binding CsgD family transcriptional regulator